MDDARFDALARSLTRARSRRGLGRLVAVLALGGMPGALGSTEADARKKRKKNNKKTKKRLVCPSAQKRCNGRCIPRDQCCANADCRSDALRCCQGECVPAAHCCGSRECIGGTSCVDGSCVCPSGQRLCPGGCLSVECCEDRHCTAVAGHICSGQRCVCPQDKLDVCNGACLPPCLSSITYARRPNCECCLKNGVGHGGQVGQCCSDRGAIGGTCAGRQPGDPCDFPEQCASNNCLFSIFGNACQA
jgi:hypothetical protein